MKTYYEPSFFLVVLILSLSACNKQKLDPKSIESVTDFCVSAVESGDTTGLYRITNDGSFITSLHELGFEFVKSDSVMGLGGWSPVMYFFADGDFHRLFYTRSVKDDKSYKLDFYERGPNMSQYCEEYYSEKDDYLPFIDINQFFQSLIWETNYSKKSFKSMKVRVKNTTPHTINKLDFDVDALINNRVVVSRRIQYEGVIYPDDIIDIDIKGMDGYYVGETISNSTLSFNPSLNSVAPQPPCVYEETLIMLRELAR